jgi:predicted transcriptional regulator
VVCLECAWRGKMLRRHLMTAHGQIPREYRVRWGLSDTHPIISRAYSQSRSTLAKQLGLGRDRQARAIAPEPLAELPKRRGRPRRAAPPAASP